MFSFHFQTRRNTNFGDNLYVVGNHELIGNWDPKKGLKLTTCKKSYPNWRSDVIETNEQNDILALEYKYVLITGNGDIYWEEGSNRTLMNALKITNWEFDKTFKARITKKIDFMSSSKTTFNTIFEELVKLDRLYISVKGDMKQMKFATIIRKDLINKRIILRVHNNYIKKNKLLSVNLPYYSITFNKNNPVMEGPFEYY